MAIISFDEFLKQSGGTSKDVRIVSQQEQQPEEISGGGLFQSLSGIAKETAGRIAGIEATAEPRPKKMVMGLGELAKGIARVGVKTISAGVSAVISDKV